MMLFSNWIITDVECSFVIEIRNLSIDDDRFDVVFGIVENRFGIIGDVLLMNI